jgi:hypothetical protein
MSIEVNSVLDDNINHNNIINENIIEVSNIYPNDLKKTNLRANQRPLIAYLRSEAFTICRTVIPYDYIRASFNKFKQGFVYYKDKLPIAFCIWKVKNHIQISGTFKELYIYLICGKKLDYKLVPRIIDDVVHFCRKNNIQYITLEPANDVLKSYYIDCGFKERDNFGGSRILELPVDNPRIMPHISHTLKKYKTHKRRSRVRVVRPNALNKN